MKKIRPYILAGIGMLLIGGAVFVWQKQIKQEVSQNNTRQEDAVTITSVTNVDISDWKTYKNEQYGYQIQYPAEWVLKNKKLSEVFLNSRENEANLEKIKSGAMYGEGYMEDVIISYYESVADEPENIANHLGAKNLDDLVSTNPLISKIEKMKIAAGEEAWMVKRGGFGTYLTVLIVHNGHLYQIMFGNREEKESLTQTDKEILKSFSFLQ